MGEIVFSIQELQQVEDVVLLTETWWVYLEVLAEVLQLELAVQLAQQVLE